LTIDHSRELAVLVDGPWKHHWYYRDELEAMQEGSRAMNYPDDHPAAQLRHYRPTHSWQPHPFEVGASAREWRYSPPA
jgi:hypothetical protein